MADATAESTGDQGQGIDWAVALAEHGRWLRLTILARLGEPQAVDEVLQEVALAAVAPRGAGVDPSRVAPWLHRLAVRQALLYRRRQGRQRRLVERFAGRIEREAVEADPLGWLLLDERAALVREALQRLPSRDAEVLLLRYVEGWSGRELASRLALSVAAVEARLHRARERLRAQLAHSSVIEARE